MKIIIETGDMMKEMERTGELKTIYLALMNTEARLKEIKRELNDTLHEVRELKKAVKDWVKGG